MKTKEEARSRAQHIANERQEPVTLYAYESTARAPFATPAFDCIESRRFERERSNNYTPVEVLEPKYRSIEDIKRRNERSGGKWFDPSNMRFFGTRVQSAIHVHKDGRAFFVTSERDRYQGPGGGAWGGRRLYSVRVALLDGSIDTVGEFGAYTTGRAAHKAAARLAAS